MKLPVPRKIELLAPARDAATAIAAIEHGADAVYIGAEAFGARSAATNSVDDIKAVCDVAHNVCARVYVTLNTIIYDHELKKAERLVHMLYDAGVDALIIQDMSLLRMDIPPIALHASTQCDIRTVEKARFLEKVGFSQLVLPREFTLDEIRAIHDNVDIPLEAFVHGALCVSYSGDCQASQLWCGRSANRGECAQVCRMAYDLVDGEGNIVEHDRHLLSLKDMNRSSDLEAMLDAGISSFKIEGRLKDTGYVKNIVTWYRQKLDKIIDTHPDLYIRASAGRVNAAFTPHPSRSFNRGFTNYFLTSPQPADSIASIYTPKSQGEPVGVTTGISGKAITARLDTALANGDGLGYFTPEGKFQGFRLNRIEGNRLFPATKVDIPAATPLYRTSDKAMDDILAHEKTERTLWADMTLTTTPDGIKLDMADETGAQCSVTREYTAQNADKPQDASQHRILSKLGGTLLRLRKLTNDTASPKFIPASILADMRREGVEQLAQLRNKNFIRDMRRQEDVDAKYPSDTLTYHDNVANRLAEEFYREHGVTDITYAAEVRRPDHIHPVVMTTRYCLRRELGKCLRTPEGISLKGPLAICNDALRLQLEFDCRNCQMHIRL